MSFASYIVWSRAFVVHVTVTVPKTARPSASLRPEQRRAHTRALSSLRTCHVSGLQLTKRRSSSMSRKQDSKYNAAEAAIVTFVEALGKLAANADMRTMVRDAGAISPLVALLVSGTGNVPGLAASVLRDLALHSGNRTAILESDGVAQLVRMLHNESKVIASEAADALRSLAANNGAVCKVVRDNGGIKMLVKLAQGGKAAEAATGADCPYTGHGPDGSLAGCQAACVSAGAAVCTMRGHLRTHVA